MSTEMCLTSCCSLLVGMCLSVCLSVCLIRELSICGSWRNWLPGLCCCFSEVNFSFYAFIVSEGVMFVGCPVVPCIRLVRYFLPRYLINGLNNFDITDMVYSLTWLDCWGQRSRSQLAVEVKSCERHISWTVWAISMKLTGNNHYSLLMTWLDVGGQRSRSQQA